MILTMFCCAVLWLFLLASLLVGRNLLSSGDHAETPLKRAISTATEGALVGCGAGLALWSVLLVGPSTTLQIEGGEFGWLPYVTLYPFRAVLAGALIGAVTAVGLRREQPMLWLRVAGVVVLGWAAYGLVLAQPPTASDLVPALVLAQRGVAALGSAAITVVCVDLFFSPPVGAPLIPRLLERLLIVAASLLTLLFAQTVVWDELLARLFGLPVR